MAGLVEQTLQRDEPFAAPQPYAATKTRLVRPARDSVITAAQCVCPKRGFGPIEREFASPDRRHRAFLLPDRMKGREPVPQLRPVDPVLGPAALEPGLGLRDAILDGLHGVAARQRPPESCPVGLQDDIRVHQHGAAMPSHDASWLGRLRDAVHREQIREVVDTRLEQCRGPAHRDEALPDREPENLHERS